MKVAKTRCLAYVVGFLVAGSAFALGPSEVFTKAAPSIWAVRALDGQERPFSFGSGIAIGEGRLITRCHVLAKAKGIQVRRGGSAHDARLEHADVERDLCLLRVEDFAAPAVTVAPGEPRIGQRVYAIASIEKLGPTLTEGLVAGLQSEDPAIPPIRFTGTLANGASGGALFDEDGRLVAIATLNVPGVSTPGMHFASPAAWIAEVPERSKLQLARRAAAQAPRASEKTPASARGVQSWTYRVSGRDVKARAQEVRLSSATAQEIVEELVAEDGTSRREVHTQGAYIASVGGLSLFSPYLPAFWKVVPGMRLPEIENRDPRLCGGGWTCTLTSRVVGAERIKVPAGELDTVHVRVEQSWISVSQTNDRGENGGRTLDVWYAPEFKRAVRFSSRGEPSRFIDTSFELELASHSE